MRTNRKIILDPDAVTDTSVKNGRFDYLVFGVSGIIVGLLIGFLIWWTP